MILAALSGVLVIAQLVVAKAARDTLFLSAFPTSALPIAAIITAAATLPAVFGGSALISKTGPQRFLPNFLLINGLGFAAEWAALPRAPQLVAGILYVHVGLFGGLSTSGFWSVINERFDPHTARSAASRVASGFALGGVVGGLLADRITTCLGVRALLATLLVSNIVLVALVTALARPGHSHAKVEKSAPGIQVLARSRYLQSMALLVVLAAVASSSLDYSFKSAVRKAVADPDSLAKFFASYYMITSIGNVFLQATASRYSLQKLGIGVTLGVLPAALIAGSMLTATLGGLWPVVLLRGAEAVLSASFFRSAYEPLYTPLPSHKKRSTKAIIDVAADKIGDAVGSGAIWLVLSFMPRSTLPASLGIVMASASVVLWLATRLQRGYVAQLAASLRNGVVKLQSNEVEDATTRLAVSRTFSGVSREVLLREIAAARKEHTAEPDLVRSASELLSGDPQRIVRELSNKSLSPELAGYAIPLLEFNDTRDAAARALRELGERCVGQLTDALLDPKGPVMVRHRIPAVMAQITSARSVQGLTLGLRDEDFELRECCARALLAIKRSDITLCPPPSEVMATLQRELAVPNKEWTGRGPAVSIQDSALSQIASGSASRSLQHVFTVLGLWLDPEELELSLRALNSNETKLRGTALEYLENVLPSEIKSAFLQHLTDPRTVSSRAPRSHKEIADELKRSISD